MLDNSSTAKMQPLSRSSSTSTKLSSSSSVKSRRGRPVSVPRLKDLCLDVLVKNVNTFVILVLVYDKFICIPLKESI